MDILPLITNLGDPLSTLTLVILLVKLKPELARLLAISAILVILFVGPIKLITGVQRPCEGCDSLSFPSYHSASAFSNALILSIQFPQAAPLFFLLASAVSYSRVHIGVHHLSDIIFGALLGFFSAAITIKKFEMKNLSKIHK